MNMGYDPSRDREGAALFSDLLEPSRPLYY